MELRFGNLSPEQMGERMGWNFSKADLAWLKEHRIESAQFSEIGNGNGFHIFDIPFQIICAPSISEKLCTMLKTYDIKSKGLAKMQIIELKKEH